MITPGEEAILILLVAATLLLFNFSTLSTMSALQQEAHQKTVFLRADKTADLIKGGTPPEEIGFENVSIQANGRQYGREEAQDYLETRRFSYSEGRLVQIRARAW